MPIFSTALQRQSTIYTGTDTRNIYCILNFQNYALMKMFVEYVMKYQNKKKALKT